MVISIRRVIQVSRHAEERWHQRFSQFGESIEACLERARPASVRQLRQIQLQAPVEFKRKPNNTYKVARGKRRKRGEVDTSHYSHNPDMCFVLNPDSTILITCFPLHRQAPNRGRKQ